MPICPVCTCWLSQNAQNTDWVKCDQGHHYRKGEVKHETGFNQPPFERREPKLLAGNEFDVRSDSWVSRDKRNRQW